MKLFYLLCKLYNITRKTYCLASCHLRQTVLWMYLNACECKITVPHLIYSDIYFFIHSFWWEPLIYHFLYISFSSTSSAQKVALGLTREVSLTSASLSFGSLREDGALSVIAAEATAAAVREDERRVDLAGERERLWRRPGDRERERERERIWKPRALWGKTANETKKDIANINNCTSD